MTIDSVGSSNTSGYSFTGGADVNPTYISSTSITPYTGMVGGGKQRNNRFGRRLTKKLKLMGNQRSRSVKRSIKKVKRKRRLKKGLKRRTIRQDIIKSIERGEPISKEKSKKLTPSMQKFLQGIETGKSESSIKFSDFKKSPLNKQKKYKKKKKRTKRKAMTGGMDTSEALVAILVGAIAAGAALGARDKYLKRKEARTAAIDVIPVPDSGQDSVPSPSIVSPTESEQEAPKLYNMEVVSEWLMPGDDTNCLGPYMNECELRYREWLSNTKEEIGDKSSFHAEICDCVRDLMTYEKERPSGCDVKDEIWAAARNKADELGSRCKGKLDLGKPILE
jgi:hypothetical protein